jgi:hypothetical protein
MTYLCSVLLFAVPLLQAAPFQEDATSNKANVDPVYRQLRFVGVGSSFSVKDLTVPFDVAGFELKDGTLTLLAPVNGVVTGAIFVGQGHFRLKPPTALDRRELVRRMGAEQVDEDFTQVVFRFSKGMDHLFAQATTGVPTPPAAGSAFHDWQDQVRHRRENAAGFSEFILTGSGMDNIDAELLAGLYNEAHGTYFSAFVKSGKHGSLRLLSKARGGAIAGFDSPEEVALINYDPEGNEDGIWYMDHSLSELQQHTANSLEERRYETVTRMKIDTVIGNNTHLTSVANVKFKPVIAGERVVKFNLLPNLRVSRVADASGKDIAFIQESRKADGSFYVVLPAATEAGKEYAISIEYAGDKVIMKAGEGSFYVGAREEWYPNLNGFGERSLYDLTFRVPKKYKVISVGSLQSEGVEDGMMVSHWVTPQPVAVAGFNFGAYQKIDLADDITHYKLEGYYLKDLPDSVKDIDAFRTMAPTSMTKHALEIARAQLQVCTYFFGPAPFDHIALTEQPDFFMGQSWPNLVYLPMLAYMDSTQRWMAFGNQNKLTAFVDEVTPHEVSHQWWGHAVGWASYHDQWLSEGFAEFSAALFLEQAQKNSRNDYIQFWDRQRKRILEKNTFGIAATDAGPIWLGLRLVSPQTHNAYQEDTYAKGAYVLGMLRSIMHTNQEGDKAFIAMMHDFVTTYANAPASTEAFQAVVEKHMTPAMNIEGNGRMDWFFREWVYGTRVPKYKFDYQITPASDGTSVAHLSITQSEVDEKFAMLLPVFADIGKGSMIRFGEWRVVGNNTATYDVKLPVTPKKLELDSWKEILQR